MKLDSLAMALKRARKDAGLTQEELAEALKARGKIGHIRTIMNWEQGISAPSMGMLIYLTEFYDCDLDYLTGRIDCKTHDLQFIHDVTGLSEEAIKKLIAWKNDAIDSSLDTSHWADYLSKMIENDLSDRYLERLQLGIISRIDEVSYLKNTSSRTVSDGTLTRFSEATDATILRLSRVSSDLAEEIIDEEVTRICKNKEERNG